MNKSTIVLVAVLVVFGAYSFGQANQRASKVEPCCCKHTQQMAEDLRAIRKQLDEGIKVKYPKVDWDGIEDIKPIQIDDTPVRGGDYGLPRSTPKSRR